MSEEERKLNELSKLLEMLFHQGGWFTQFFQYFVSAGLVILFLLYIYQYATGKTDFLGRPREQQQDPSASILRLEHLQLVKDELEEKVTLLEKERHDLMEEMKEINDQNEALENQYKQLNEELKRFQQENQKLEENLQNEIYTFTQIMAAVNEVISAIVYWENFQQNRDDIYMNILDSMIGTMTKFRLKDPRVVIHVSHPLNENYFCHFAHSSSHTHRVKQYEPPKHGSAAGRAWRTNQVYYVPDVTSDKYEYERKEGSRKLYRTILCIPLMIGDDEKTKLGVLSMTGYTPDAYSERDMETVILFTKLLYPLVYWELKRIKPT